MSNEKFVEIQAKLDAITQQATQMAKERLGVNFVQHNTSRRRLSRIRQGLTAVTIDGCKEAILNPPRFEDSVQETMKKNLVRQFVQPQNSRTPKGFPTIVPKGFVRRGGKLMRRK
jgi:hypothetical protein